LTKDILFKYEDKYIKKRILGEDIQDKKYSEKAQFISNFIINSKDNGRFDLTAIDLLNNLEKNISANILEKIDTVLDSEYIEIREQINNFENILQNLSKSFTKFDNPLIKITSENFYNIYDPMFSGEFNLETQFDNLVSNGLSNIYALSLLQEYMESQLTKSNIYSLSDLYNIKLILIPLKFENVLEVFKNVSIVQFDSLEMININIPYLSTKTYKTYNKPAVPVNMVEKVNMEQAKFKPTFTPNPAPKQPWIIPKKKPVDQANVSNKRVFNNITGKTFCSKITRLDDETTKVVDEPKRNFAKLINSAVINFIN